MARTKVVVGMSGGVDSSATAAILVEQGYEVQGVTLKVWHEEENPARRWQERSCCKVGLARYVAKRLGIPHQVVEIEATFYEAVIRDFVSGYLAGETPNPCVRCNERIKFGLLYRIARDLGADYLATGHYVRLDRGPDGHHRLKRAIDENKDQSYFLYRLRPEILPHLIFPVGTMRKEEVFRRIEALDLPPEEIRESQEICFVTQGDYRGFLAREAPAGFRPGLFVTSTGEVLGKHEGVAGYTVGQRRGLGLSSRTPGERLYVLGIDAPNNRVMVGSEEELYARELTAADLNYLIPIPPGELVEILAKIRYRSPTTPAVLQPLGDGKAKVIFKEPQRAVTPGQSVVFYQDDLVLGGGRIQAVSP
jgi:tRNA-specific 2-thiouridylase